MADRRPPRIEGDERATLMTLFQFQRESMVRKVEGLTDDDARRQLVPTGTTLLWLLKHLTMAEIMWVERRFGGHDVEIPDPTVLAADTVASAVAGYQAAWAKVDAVVASTPSLDVPCRGLDDGGPPSNLRWVLGHLLEETARHAGHADILRELIDGDTGR